MLANYSQLSWEDALERCAAMCAELISVDSVQEFEFINTALQIIRKLLCLLFIAKLKCLIIHVYVYA